MDVILGPALKLFFTLVDLYIWIVVIGVILNWLVGFNVVNRHNRFVHLVGDFIHRLTEPALRPIRRLIPNLGGFDISPVILVFALIFIKDILIEVAVRLG